MNMPQVSWEREEHNEYKTHWERGEVIAVPHKPQCIVHLSHQIADTLHALWIHCFAPSEFNQEVKTMTNNGGSVACLQAGIRGSVVFYAFRVILPTQRCRECTHLWLIFMRCCDIWCSLRTCMYCKAERILQCSAVSQLLLKKSHIEVK